MILSLKLKLRLALVFIFGLLLLVFSSSHYALFKITDRTKNVFKANYESLEYVEQMRAALDVPDFQQFEQYLKKQERNVTEVGEAEVTVLLREGFTNFLKVRSDTLRRQVRQHLSTIHQLNRQAIIRANDATYALAERYAFWLAIVGTGSALLVFVLIFNLPDYIAKPVLRLREGIQKIAAKDYSARIHEHSHDEFGALSHAFNDMAAQLEHWEKSNLAVVMRAKQRVEAVIALFPDAVIGLDEAKKILFINPPAAELLAINPPSAIGKYAPDVALHNDLLRELLTIQAGHKHLKIFTREGEVPFDCQSFAIADQEGGNIGQVILLKTKSL